MLQRALGAIERPFEKRLAKKSMAQGTIEYLVIIAVVVVIGLVVVSLANSFLGAPAQQLSSATIGIGASTGPIGILDAVLDPSGKGIVSLRNNSGQDARITKITLGGQDTVPAENYFPSGGTQSFSLTGMTSGACSCEGAVGQTKACEATIYREPSSGLPPQPYSLDITVDCVADAKASSPSTVVPPACLAGGSGTIADPIIVCDCLGLQGMNLRLDANYALGADIDCSVSRTWDFNSFTGSYQGFSPVGRGAANPPGFGSNTFMGSFDGRNRRITGLYINRPLSSFVALFGYVGTSPIGGNSISNVSLLDANITGGYAVATLVGWNLATVTNCSASGEVLALSAPNGGAGGLVAANHAFLSNMATISGSHADVKVTSIYRLAGGLCYSNSGLITRSYAAGKVSAGSDDSEAGGLAGENWSRIEHSYATGDVNAASMAGGLVGNCAYYGYVYDSYATGDANASGPYAGGFAGQNACQVVNSYATGDARSSDYAGGFAGYNTQVINDHAGDVNNSFSTGNAFAPSHVGGFVGVNDGGAILSNSFYSGSPNAGGGTYEAAGPSAFYSASHSVYAGGLPRWDFVTVWQSRSGNFPALR